MSEPNPIDRDKAQANQDIEDILALRRFPPFTRYFLRRLDEKMEPIRSELLTNINLTPAELKAKQETLGIYRGIARLLDDDEVGNRSIAGRPFPTPE